MAALETNSLNSASLNYKKHLEVYSETGMSLTLMYIAKSLIQKSPVYIRIHKKDIDHVSVHGSKFTHSSIETTKAAAVPQTLRSPAACHGLIVTPALFFFTFP